MTAWVLMSFCVWSQGDAISQAADKTVVRVELLAPRKRNGLTDQQWARVFDDLGVSVRIRNSLTGETASVTEKKRGRLRFVTAIGEMKADGSVAFSENDVFRATDVVKLKDWVDGLQTFGAAGAPNNQQGWGLTPAGRSQVERRFARPASKPKQRTIAGVVAMLGRVTELPTRIDADAVEFLDEPIVWPQDTLAVGTLASLVLESAGLIVVPTRMPAGGTELVIKTSDADVGWPVGWESPEGVRPTSLVPALFNTTELSADTETLPQFLSSLRTKTDVPIVCLRGELLTKARDWEAVTVPGTSRAKPPILVLIGPLRGAGLTKEYRVDDAATPFVLIRAFDPYRKKAQDLVPPPAISRLWTQLGATGEKKF